MTASVSQPAWVAAPGRRPIRVHKIALRGLATVRFAELPHSAKINEALIAAFGREQDGANVKRTHMFHGRFENIYIPAERLPEIAPVSAFARDVATRVLGRTDLRCGFWFNAMSPGHRTTRHSHEENDERLSAVYYLACPADSGRLILHDEAAQIIVTPQQGLLVVFPPNLPHEVEENRSETMRLSVAFNFGPAN